MKNLTIIGTVLPNLDAEAQLASLVAVKVGLPRGPDHQQQAADMWEWINDNVPAPTRRALAELMSGGEK